jgi:hypothetical protein
MDFARHVCENTPQFVMSEKFSIPVWAVVCGAWVCAYLALFVHPVFLNAGQTMAFPRTVPTLDPIGVDFRALLGSSRAWLEMGNPSSCYPPLAAVGFAPFVALPFSVAYAVMTGLTLLAYLSVTLVLPLRVFPRADRAAVLAVSMAGLFSYGLLFEFERGQYNVLAMACVAWGLFLFHRGRGRGARWAAYALFSAAIQLKVYPAIFVFAFAKEARAWKQNLARWAGLGAANVALLFALGPQAFGDFLRLLKLQAVEPYVWVGNHSIQSLAERTGHPWIVPAFTAVYAACFLWALRRQIRPGGPGAFAGLLLMSALGAMLIPGVSHDYKLTVLTLAFAFFAASAAPLSLRGIRAGVAAGLFLVLCFLQAWMQFSYVLKPAGVQNNAPFLLALAAGLTLWMGVAEKPVEPGARTDGGAGGG